jgi:hypothetical protein
MSLYLGILAAVGLLVFLLLPLRVKMLLSFIVMTKGFDLVPSIVGGVDVWDCGAALFLISALPLLFSKTPRLEDSPFYLVAFKIFYAWLLVCLAWSLVGYHYPWLHTFKVARQMVLGYATLFALIAFFLADQKALPFFLRWLYRTTFLLLPVSIAQTLFKLHLLSSLTQQYGSVSRAIPVFLPVTLFFLFGIVSRFYSGQRVRLHEAIYAALALVATALTYTRGIYLAFAAVSLLALGNLAYHNRLKAQRLLAVALLLTCCLPFLAWGGYLDRVIDRFSSGVGLVAFSPTPSGKHDVDSFKGRLDLTRERFDLVWERNPLVGLGFLHEDDVPASLRNSFKSGSVITTPEYLKRYRYIPRYTLALYSADIGWANLVLMTGFGGLAVFLLFLACFFASFYRRAALDETYFHLRHAFFLQTVLMAILMFNGDTFVAKLQVACLMLAGYAVTTHLGLLSPGVAPPPAAGPAQRARIARALRIAPLGGRERTT